MQKLHKALIVAFLLFGMFWGMNIRPVYSAEHATIDMQKQTISQNSLLPPDVKANLKNKHDEPNVLNITGSLITVILLIFAVLIVYSKINNIPVQNRLTKKLEDKKLKEKFNIITSANLAPGKSLYLVEIGGKQLVLGSTSSSINMLCEIDDATKTTEEKIDPINKPVAPKEQEEEPFSTEVDIYKDYIS